MRAELIKIRSMPTPKWCLAAVAASFVAGLAATVAWGSGEDSDAIDLAIRVPSLIASMVFAVWMLGVEYGQNTLRRTLTSDPRRVRVMAVKLLMTLLCVAVVTALLYALAIPLYDVASSGHSGAVGAETVARYGAVALINNLVFAVIGFAFALITASMAGGITMTLVFVFVVDSVTQSISWLSDFAMEPALSAITDGISGYDTDIFGESATAAGASDILVVVAWLVGLTVLGGLRFVRSEVK